MERDGRPGPVIVPPPRVFSLANESRVILRSYPAAPGRSDRSPRRLDHGRSRGSLTAMDDERGAKDAALAGYGFAAGGSGPEGAAPAIRHLRDAGPGECCVGRAARGGRTCPLDAERRSRRKAGCRRRACWLPSRVLPGRCRGGNSVCRRGGWAALGLMGAAGFGLVLSDAGTPLRQRTHQASRRSSPTSRRTPRARRFPQARNVLPTRRTRRAHPRRPNLLRFQLPRCPH